MGFKKISKGNIKNYKFTEFLVVQWLSTEFPIFIFKKKSIYLGL